MTLDFATLAIVLTTISLTLSLSVLYVAWCGQDEDGLALWGGGLMLYSLSYPAFMLRLAGWPLLSIGLSGTLFAATMAVLTLAVARFQRGRGVALPLPLVWLPVGLSQLVALVLLERHQLRTFVLTALLLLMAAGMTWQAWNPGQRVPRERGRVLLAAGSLLLVLLTVSRLFWVARAGDWSNPLLVPLPLQSLTALMTVSVILLCTMGFVLMQKEQAVELQRLAATHDALTGVANRRALNDELDREVSRASRSGQPLSLLMVDIDWFKKVNDQHGHQVGDGVLRELAARLRERLRQHDLLARFGGEEFVVLLPDTPEDGARVLAEAVRAEVADRPFSVDGKVIAITVSIGVATARPLALAGVADALIRCADEALYRAKQGGRNRVEGGGEGVP